MHFEEDFLSHSAKNKQTNKPKKIKMQQEDDDCIIIRYKVRLFFLSTAKVYLQEC
jgi:hypothetical protein